ncbi:predicted protein [Lichtheimia corymbifera JMRC:FSU:9682]|uniref:Uncharacterized protein n=1 Tax=Lichtheimia corymbifera JMRC:FSU:9682 TaxID=1263082 RepID=A0A068SDX2_9FUNG|nr:predicted protein [Lichtheimia corymbifera JMRC:FSU:9682]
MVCRFIALQGPQLSNDTVKDKRRSFEVFFGYRTTNTNTDHHSVKSWIRGFFSFLRTIMDQHSPSTYIVRTHKKILTNSKERSKRQFHSNVVHPSSSHICKRSYIIRFTKEQAHH